MMSTIVFGGDILHCTVCFFCRALVIRFLSFFVWCVCVCGGCVCVCVWGVCVCVWGVCVCVSQTLFQREVNLCLESVHDVHAGGHRKPIELCPTKLSMVSSGYQG